MHQAKPLAHWRFDWLTLITLNAFVAHLAVAFAQKMTNAARRLSSAPKLRILKAIELLELSSLIQVRTSEHGGNGQFSQGIFS